MQLHLTRIDTNDDRTIGELRIDGKFECYTLEDAVRKEKIHGHTAIPEGKYRVVITQSPRFKKPLPLLLDVPGFEGVRIHPGNSKKDTEGCILVGQSHDVNHVWHSRDAMEVVQQKIAAAIRAKDPVWITIENRQQPI